PDEPRDQAGVADERPDRRMTGANRTGPDWTGPEWTGPAAGAVGDGTLAAHAGLAPAEPGRPPAPGPGPAGPYHPGPETGPRPGLDGYGRLDNPSWRALEAAIATLEAPEGGAACVTFGSGMAAISALLFTVLRPGDTLVLPSDGYYKTRAFVAARL